MQNGPTVAEKAVIGVLASHDSFEKNDALAEVLIRLYNERREFLSSFHFLFTGGTYRRIFEKQPIKTRDGDTKTIERLPNHCIEFYQSCSSRLPPREQGGVTILAYSVVRRYCSIIWTFLSPVTPDWLNPENLALMRLSDHWHAKRLMNIGSVNEWFDNEAEIDRARNLCPIPLTFELPGTEAAIFSNKDREWNIRKGKGQDQEPHLSYQFNQQPDVSEDFARGNFANITIALIAHDDMKKQMIDFVLDYEWELGLFKKILATGTTGREVIEAAPSLEKKLHRYHSGPKGGDIEIATEVLCGRCQIVVFFIDPLHPHPHIEDIRVVSGACMIKDQVRIMTNEAQARDWMERVVKKRREARLGI